MPTLEIKLDVPAGTSVTIAGLEGIEETPEGHLDDDPVEKYWSEYLSDNGRKVYGAAARIEEFSGPGYTLEDIAENLSITYESVRSMHRTTGRSARKWREDTGAREPIRLEWMEYDWHDQHAGMRTTYHLPAGVATAITSLPTG